MSVSRQCAFTAAEIAPDNDGAGPNFHKEVSGCAVRVHFRSDAERGEELSGILDILLGALPLASILKT